MIDNDRGIKRGKVPCSCYCIFPLQLYPVMLRFVLCAVSLAAAILFTTFAYVMYLGIDDPPPKSGPSLPLAPGSTDHVYLHDEDVRYQAECEFLFESK